MKRREKWSAGAGGAAGGPGSPLCMLPTSLSCRAKTTFVLPVFLSSRLHVLSQIFSHFALTSSSIPLFLLSAALFIYYTMDNSAKLLLICTELA